MTLQAKLDAFKADFEAGKPPYSVPRSVIETMHRATQELISSGAAQRALKVGDRRWSGDRQFLPRCVVPVLQYGSAGARSGAIGVRAAWGQARRHLASNSGEQPQVDAPEQTQLPILSDSNNFVIAPDRTIVYAEVNPDYTHRPEPEAMLPALKKISRVAA
jgi:hypothetical protein